MREQLISKHLERRLRTKSIQQNLNHRVDKIIDPTISYKLLRLLGLELHGSTSIAPASKETELAPQSALGEYTSWLQTLGPDEYINNTYKPNHKSKSPLIIADLPNQELLVVNNSHKKVLAHSLFNHQSVLDHKKNGIHNVQYLKLIVQTAASLAKVKSETPPSYDLVLGRFASSVALAQVHLSRDIRKIINFHPENTQKDLRIIHVGSQSQDSMRIPEKERVKTHLDTNIRNQVLLYAISVFSLYGFQNEMQQLMQVKAKVDPKK
jgi:hypothetical protein